ncbi:MAG: CDP-diacylglycerol--glycerol-3-phosphate 3-phosphatidyltransferase [Ruminococcaceae bacterium]|nr:CDP-diacylglycerol--glycerol-3-phosphate 3-phosphatidyltransferase [Oscillospiraceae bacterium]
MNLPNKLTVARLIMTPFFLAALLIPFPHHYLVALVIFIVASLTDYIDGNMARKCGLVTDFGKFLDPLADKMLTTSAFLGFIHLGIGIGITWITFIVLIREFLITSLRLVSAGKGNVIAANIWGKLKTVSQMIAIIVAIAGKYLLTFFEYMDTNILVCTVDIITNILLWISAIFTVISGIIYVIQNKDFIDPKK